MRLATLSVLLFFHHSAALGMDEHLLESVTCEVRMGTGWEQDGNRMGTGRENLMYDNT